MPFSSSELGIILKTTVLAIGAYSALVAAYSVALVIKKVYENEDYLEILYSRIERCENDLENNRELKKNEPFDIP